MAAISTNHMPLDGAMDGRHLLVSWILRSARQLRSIWLSRVPFWDLALVLGALTEASFEPLESISKNMLTLKMVLLLALTSLKRVGDLQAL